MNEEVDKFQAFMAKENPPRQSDAVGYTNTIEPRKFC